MEQAFVPIESQKYTTRPDTGDSIMKAQEESSFRSRSEKDSTRKGDFIAKAPTKHQKV